MKVEKEIRLKELEITLEKIKTKKQKVFHKFKMDELMVRKEIAEMICEKNKKVRITKQLKKLKEKK